MSLHDFVVSRTKCLWQPGEESQSQSLEKCRPSASHPLMLHARWTNYFPTLNPVIQKKHCKTSSEINRLRGPPAGALPLIWMNKYPIHLSHKGAWAVFKLKPYFQIQTQTVSGRKVEWPNSRRQSGWFILHSSVLWASAGLSLESCLVLKCVKNVGKNIVKEPTVAFKTFHDYVHKYSQFGVLALADLF